MSVSSHECLGTRLLSVINVSHDSVELKLRDLRTLEGIALEWVTDLESLDLCSELLHELVVDAFLDVDSGSSAAALSVVEEETEACP